jgi:hypothetical protein
MHKLIRLSVILGSFFLLDACNLSFQAGTSTPQPAAIDTQAPPATAKQADTLAAATVAFTGSQPNDPPIFITSWLTDPRTPASTSKGYAIAGDDFAHDQYERPLDKNLAYRPDLDILKAELSLDSQWLYISITLAGMDTGKQTLDANYGAEFDVDLDGRGDFVIWATPPFTNQWSRENLTVFGTTTNMVGGPHPLLSDAPWKGNTYDKVLFNGKTDALNAAWVRVSPKDPTILQIAFTRDILNKPAHFLWGAWADDGMKDPSKFDYNDLMTKKDAGSPYKWDADYPTKALILVDNTCRSAFGFSPKGTEPGICSSVPPTSVPGKPGSGPTPTKTLIPGPN